MKACVCMDTKFTITCLASPDSSNKSLLKKENRKLWEKKSLQITLRWANILCFGKVSTNGNIYPQGTGHKDILQSQALFHVAKKTSVVIIVLPVKNVSILKKTFRTVEWIGLSVNTFQ